MRTAKEIDFNSTSFSPDDFPPGELAYATPDIILALDELQGRLDHKLSIWPEPGAVARSEGDRTSRHYAIGRLSDAVDFYCTELPETVWMNMLDMRFGGIGVDFRYAGYSRSPRWKFHVDLRPQRKYWVTRKHPSKVSYTVEFCHWYRREFFQTLHKGFFTHR